MELLKCGPRALWRQPDGTYFTQIVKYIRDESGTETRFALGTDGEWHQYDKSHVFTNADTFIIEDVYDQDFRLFYK